MAKKTPPKKPKKRSRSRKPAKRAAARPSAGQGPAKARRPATKPSPRRTVRLSGDELLIEELGAARQELKRIARDENAIRRELEAALPNESNGADRLRAELEAVRLDLKTALADLEIGRAEAQRESARAQALSRELAAALEAQRLAEHAATSTREQLYELRRETDRLRAELTKENAS